MKRKYIALKALLVSMAWLIGVAFPGSVAEAQKNHATTVDAVLAAIANQLALRPEAAIDLSDVSGEYCFNTGLDKGGHMTHYAIDPTKTQEDVIDFVNAEPLLKTGVNVEALPRFPGAMGKMTPNQWYFLPAGEREPHHGKAFPWPLLIRASNTK